MSDIDKTIIGHPQTIPPEKIREDAVYREIEASGKAKDEAWSAWLAAVERNRKAWEEHTKMLHERGERR